MNAKKVILFTLTLAAILSTVTYVYAAYTLASIPTSGAYKTYAVTLTPSTIAWGDATLNVPITKTVSIQNTGTKNIGSLTMSPANLVGIGASDFTLTWDLQGQGLNIGDTKIATFTFTLINPVASTFTFDIQVIDATG